MLVDWFTAGAQALNFLILVWLMKRFLYKPVRNAIDAREKRIADELADAAKQKAEAQKEREDFQRKNAEFDSQRAELLKQATGKAKTDGERLMEDARKRAEDFSAKSQESLRVDIKSLNQAVGRQTQREVFSIARKALSDLASVSLEESMSGAFTRRLKGMDGPTKSALAQTLKTAPEAAILRSAFDLPAELHATIQNALNETFSADVRIRFVTAPDIISGIELSANGQKVAWSIAEYLAELEKSVEEILQKKNKSEITTK